MFTSRFENALVLAHQLHAAQKRKGTDIPYISHLLSVAALTIEYGGTEDEAIAALLHDGPEDAGGHQTLEVIRKRFGDAVAQMVEDCTDAWVEPKPPWKQRKLDYLTKLETKAPASLRVSLADKVHNAEAILRDYERLGDSVWSRFTASPQETVWYYQGCSRAFSSRIPGPLAERLAAAVERMAQAAGVGNN